MGGRTQIIKGLERVFQRYSSLSSKRCDHGKISENIILVAGLIKGPRREVVTEDRTTC